MSIFTNYKKGIRSTVLGVSASALLIATPAAAFAHGGGSGNTSGSRNDSRHSQAQMASKHSDGDKSWQNRNTKPDPKPTPTCAELQASLNQRAVDAAARKTKQLTGMNIVLTGVQTYVSSGNVTVSNYDALNANATANQTLATNAVAAIVAPQIDCNDTANLTKNNKVANDTLNQSIWNAHKALNGYRHSEMNLFNAVINTDTSDS